MIGNQPIGEYPPIDMYDLLPMELRLRALIAIRATWDALAGLVGFDVFPSFTDDFAALLHVPIAPNK